MNWQAEYKLLKQVVYSLLKTGSIDLMLEVNDAAEALFWANQPLYFVGWEQVGFSLDNSYNEVWYVGN